MITDEHGLAVEGPATRLAAATTLEVVELLRRLPNWQAILSVVCCQNEEGVTGVFSLHLRWRVGSYLLLFRAEDWETLAYVGIE